MRKRRIFALAFALFFVTSSFGLQAEMIESLQNDKQCCCLGKGYQCLCSQGGNKMCGFGSRIKNKMVQVAEWVAQVYQVPMLKDWACGLREEHQVKFQKMQRLYVDWQHTFQVHFVFARFIPQQEIAYRFLQLFRFNPPPEVA